MRMSDTGKGKNKSSGWGPDESGLKEDETE